jgi:hypothetical protein
MAYVLVAHSPLAAAEKAIAEIKRIGTHSKRGPKAPGYRVASRMVWA